MSRLTHPAKYPARCTRPAAARLVDECLSSLNQEAYVRVASKRTRKKEKDMRVHARSSRTDLAY